MVFVNIFIFVPECQILTAVFKWLFDFLQILDSYFEFELELVVTSVTQIGRCQIITLTKIKI